MGLIVFVGLSQKSRGFAARDRLLVEIVGLASPFVDEIGRKVECFRSRVTP